MKILFIISSLNKCGPVNQLYELFSSNHSMEGAVILTLKSECASPRNKDFEDIGVQIKTPRSPSSNIISLFNAINYEIQTGGYDVICSQGIRSDFYCACLSFNLRKRVLSIVHNYIYPDYRDRYSFFIGFLMTKVHLWALHRLCEVVSVSASVSSYLKNKYGLNSVAIPNGVSLKQYNSKKLTFELKKLVGIYVGPLIKRKSVDTLLHSFSNLVRLDFELNIVGDGDQYHFLKKKYALDSRIRFLGFRDDIDDIYRNSDFYVSSSKAEGLPMSVLEALSHGLPCLLSNIPPHQELRAELPLLASITDFSKLNEIDCFLDSIYVSTNREDRLSSFANSRFSSLRMMADYLEKFKDISKR